MDKAGFFVNALESRRKNSGGLENKTDMSRKMFKTIEEARFYAKKLAISNSRSTSIRRMPGFFVVDFHDRLANTPDSEIQNELDANPKGVSFIEEVRTEKEERRNRLEEELERKKAEREVRRAIAEKERRERKSRQQEAPRSGRSYSRNASGSIYTGEENSDKRS